MVSSKPWTPDAICVTSAAIADTLRIATAGDYDQGLAKLNFSQRQIPVVVRLEGTNVEQGRAILRESEFHFLVADTMADAAKKVGASIQGGA